jgi:DNA invertase Pin-like site-specific DNA recombinase
MAVPITDWRERVAAENRRQRDLRAEIAASARRRAAAFVEGTEELGSKSAVAREIGIDVRAVRRAINEYGPATAPPPVPPDN